MKSEFDISIPSLSRDCRDKYSTASNLGQPLAELAPTQHAERQGVVAASTDDHV